MAVSWRTQVFLLFVLSVTGIQGARILAYFPTPSISHQVTFRPLTQELARRGHEVYVVTADPVFPKGQAPANLTEIDVREGSYKRWQQVLAHHSGNKDDILLQVKKIFESFAAVLDYQMETPQVKSIIRNKPRNYYDLLILEACNRPLMGMAHIFDAPVIIVSSFGAVSLQYSMFGAPTHPLLYPTPGSQRLYNLTFWEKGFELFKNVALSFLISSTEDFDNQIMRKHFGNDVPTYEELSSAIRMMFLNEHPIWADNHPVPPSIQYIGGIHQAEAKELPTELKNYLDSSKNGVIYVSFGTNVLPSILQPEKIQVMVKVFSDLPYNVLWKWDKDTLPGQSKNIKIAKWFPQTDVLRHPNVKLFVTQGGIQSTDEAIDATVPLIGIPMLGDQWYNVEKYVYHGIGKQLDLLTLTENEFKEAVTTVIEDKSFKNNIVRLRNIMRSNPIKPLDKAVWWVEHVLQYDGHHLQSPAARLTWFEYYEIKLVLVSVAIVASILAILGYITKLIIKLIYNLLKSSIKIKVQ
ncbi:UDP-glucosyltransferase 2-like [Melitaea cinxia]|uniref:UDP-glucosyltransferase 2-like n=1 Tax=Melitaea cinxia TaxID=113334 RepID=UPI001E27366E|nr:UDP-glucosyltransferase 2-like [Melitaea cinxia]